MSAENEPTAITTVDGLTGPQRAAVLLMVLDKDSARKLLSYLSVREVEDIGHAVGQIDTVEPDVVEKIVSEFVKDLARSSMIPKTGRDFAITVLPDLVGGERGQKVGGTLRRAFSTEFQEFCAANPPRTLATLLRDEHPQTQAVALLMMGPETAASVLGAYDDDTRFDVSLRMARLDGVPATIADDIEAALREALDSKSGDRWQVKGIDKTARVLGRLNKGDVEPLLEKISDTDPELSDVLRRRMITFADLQVLDDRSVQALLKQVDRQTLLVALRGAEPTMRELFLRNMSSRAASDLREEIELMAPLPKSQVVLAQEEIVQVVQKLAEEGVVRLYIGGDELV
ncbi:MAG: flagellar motor switch protein FliG [Myxococcota bacterium]